MLFRDIKSSTCCCKNLPPLFLLLLCSNVWRKPVISIFGTWSWRTKENEKNEFFFFFFLLINNVEILLIIKRLPNQVHWGSTMGAQIKKQKNNGQEKKKRKNKKNEKRPHSIQRVFKKKDLISSKECSQPSKLLAFLSRQMHQIKQIGRASCRERVSPYV